jgi:PAS domain-containing protein
MNHSELQVRGLTDPQLSVHATSALPVWLWASDGTRILWANPVGARVFGAANGTGLARRTFGPADAHRRQIAQLAGRLPANGAIRHERLSGFGASLGSLMTCGCARLNFFDRNHFSSNGGILIVAHAARPIMPLSDRLQQLLEGVAAPLAAFTRDGILVGTSNAARRLLGFLISVRPASRTRATRRSSRAAPRRRSALATWYCSGSARAPTWHWLP